MKSLKLLKNCTKETSILPAIQKWRFCKIYFAWNKGITYIFFDNLQKTLKKSVWKHMKFYTVTHRIASSTTRIIFVMNCQNTSLKYKKEFKQIYSCILYSKRCKKFFKLQRKLIERIHTAVEKPVQPFCHLNTSNTCQNSGNSLPAK